PSGSSPLPRPGSSNGSDRVNRWCAIPGRGRRPRQEGSIPPRSRFATQGRVSMRSHLQAATIVAALALAACGGGADEVEPGDMMAGDSLVPIADEAMLPDTTVPAPPETVYTERPAPPPAAPRPRPSPAPPAATPAPPPAPAPAARSI